MSIINRVVLCGTGGRDYGCLLVLLPVPRQQHGGVWMEVLVNLENENYEDEMKIENDFSFICFPPAFL